MQEALDPSGTSRGHYLDGRSCFGSWGSGTAEDYCTWHDRSGGGRVYGVLCGGCTASEEPRDFGNYDYLGCSMDSDNPTLVTYLGLNDCGLEGSLPWSLLGQLTRLQVLTLDGNPDLTGTALGEEGLAALTQLRLLGLGYNTQLSGTVPAAALGGLAQLRQLDLRDTPHVDAAQCESFCDAHRSTVSAGCWCPPLPPPPPPSEMEPPPPPPPPNEAEVLMQVKVRPASSTPWYCCTPTPAPCMLLPPS
eukprot:SAG31_NODE_13421_length_870_cov_1.998703_1_plen_247_part_01